MVENDGFMNNSIITCSGNKEVDLDALNLLASGTNSNLCSCTYKEEKGHHNFSYATNRLIPLSQLYASFSFEDALALLSAAASIIVALKSDNLILDNFKITKEYVLKSDESYQFIYIPIIRKEHMSIKDFIIKLISVMRIKDQRINQLVKTLKKLKNDEQVIGHLNQFLSSFFIHNHQVVDADDATTLLNNAVAEANIPYPEAETSLLSAEGETTVLSKSSYTDAQPSDGVVYSYERVTEFYQDVSAEYETTVLTSQPVFTQSGSILNMDCEYLMFLIRNLTGEKIPIEVTPFTIGKERSNMDYVLENDSVSRHHATILYEDGRYYIMDNRSTNGTVIEGIQLQPYEKAELENGYIISIGNESFQTLLERR